MNNLYCQATSKLSMVSFFPVLRSQSDTNLLNPVLVTFCFYSFQGVIGKFGLAISQQQLELRGFLKMRKQVKNVHKLPSFKPSTLQMPNPYFISPSPATTFRFSNLPTSPIPSSGDLGFRILSDHIVELEVPGLTVLVQLRKPLENLTQT